MNGRDELLRMMLSRNITPEEFNFDRLDAPPVEYFLSRQDIDDLIYLANSVKYSAKIDFKYKEIDRILKARGFELLGRGTNRVVYKYLENNTICLKVAIDHIGATDNPHEFINQQYLKPFVSKIFHTEPSGTIAVAERVHPISTREEFMQYAEGIYDLITKWFIGKYVVNDIGTKYFMNWGIRYSTGMPVLLDYPYFYLLDIRKAKCISELEDGSICCGDIDYDDGYNILTCTKCGRHYKAIELAKDNPSLNAHSIITGGNKMRAVVTIKKGSNVEKITTNPETKKLEEQYSYAANVSTRVVKKVIEDKAAAERSINNGADSVSILNGKIPAVRVKKSQPVSVVINENNKAESDKQPRAAKKHTSTDSKFVQKGGKNKATKKHKVSISNGRIKEDDSIMTLDPRIETTTASIKTAKNPDMVKKTEDIVIKEIPEETKIEVEEDIKQEDTIEVTSAEDETSVINDEGVHVEDESHVEDQEEEPSEESEVNINDAEESREVLDEIVEESTEDVESLAEAVTEAINEATEEVINEIDESEDPDAEAVAIMEAEAEIRAERDAMEEDIEEKKTTKKSKANLNPNFYGKSMRRSTKDSEESKDE